MASQRQHTEQSRESRAALLDELIRRRRPTLIRQAGFHSESSEDADDALSEASVQFLRHFHGEDDREALLWMQTVVKRCAWRIAEARRRRREAGDEELPVDLADERRGPAVSAEAADEVQHFAAALMGLKADERRAVLLIAAGYSYAEVGAIRGWTRTKVNRCAAEGRARLRALLGDGGENSWV